MLKVICTKLENTVFSILVKCKSLQASCKHPPNTMQACNFSSSTELNIILAQNSTADGCIISWPHQQLQPKWHCWVGRISEQQRQPSKQPLGHAPPPFGLASEQALEQCKPHNKVLHTIMQPDYWTHFFWHLVRVLLEKGFTPKCHQTIQLS